MLADKLKIATFIVFCLFDKYCCVLLFVRYSACLRCVHVLDARAGVHVLREGYCREMGRVRRRGGDGFVGGGGGYIINLSEVLNLEYPV